VMEMNDNTLPRALMMAMKTTAFADLRL